MSRGNPPSQIPETPSDIQPPPPSTVQVRPFFPSSLAQDISSVVPMTAMQASVPIALTLALTGMPVDPQNVLP